MLTSSMNSGSDMFSFLFQGLSDSAISGAGKPETIHILHTLQKVKAHSEYKLACEWTFSTVVCGKDISLWERDALRGAHLDPLVAHPCTH